MNHEPLLNEDVVSGLHPPYSLRVRISFGDAHDDVSHTFGPEHDFDDLPSTLHNVVHATQHMIQDYCLNNMLTPEDDIFFEFFLNARDGTDDEDDDVNRNELDVHSFELRFLRIAPVRNLGLGERLA